MIHGVFTGSKSVKAKRPGSGASKDDKPFYIKHLRDRALVDSEAEYLATLVDDGGDLLIVLIV